VGKHNAQRRWNSAHIFTFCVFNGARGGIADLDNALQTERWQDRFLMESVGIFIDLTLSNPIFLPPTYFPALIYSGRERGWWITCNYPTVLKEKNRSRKSTTCAICWLKSVLHEEKRREQENHNVGRIPTL
jgi:hypothetical protein